MLALATQTGFILENLKNLNFKISKFLNFKQEAWWHSIENGKLSMVCALGVWWFCDTLSLKVVHWKWFIESGSLEHAETSTLFIQLFSVNGVAKAIPKPVPCLWLNVPLASIARWTTLIRFCILITNCWSWAACGLDYCGVSVDLTNLNSSW